MGYVLRWLSRSWDRPNCLFGNIAITAFVVAQFMDGVSTYIGVVRLGTGVEYNMLVSWAMSVLGAGLGLIVVKLVAVGGGSFIYMAGYHNVVVTLTAIYVAVAILPWVYLFLTI